MLVLLAGLLTALGVALAGTTVPAAVAGEDGRRVVLRGVLEQYAALTSAHLEHELDVLRSDGRMYVLHSDDPLPPPGTRVQVTGTLRGDHLWVARVEVLEPAEHRANVVPRAPARTKVLAMRVHWGDRPSAPGDAEAQQALMAGPAAWFAEVSHGRYRITGTVTPWLKIKRPPGGCGDVDRIMTRALAKAARKGFRPADYGRHLVYEACDLGGIVGLATIGGGKVWLFGDLSLGTNVHEQGHNLRLQHANGRFCKRDGHQVSWSSKCTVWEYADASDAMGNVSAGHYNAWFKHRLGWLQKKRTLTADATVTLVPAETTGSGLKAVRVEAGRKRSYWLELRTAEGLGADLPSEALGVQVRLASGGTSQLLDLTPDDGHWDPFVDVTLREGGTWTTPEGVRLTVLSRTAASAEVRVDFGAGASAAPDAPTPLLATPGTGSARLSWQRPDDNGASVTEYVVTASPGGYRQRVRTFGGTTTTTTLGELESGTAYTVSVVAVNEAGSSKPATTQVTPTGPRARMLSPAEGATVSGELEIGYSLSGDRTWEWLYLEHREWGHVSGTWPGDPLTWTTDWWDDGAQDVRLVGETREGDLFHSTWRTLVLDNG